jgi:hypothetical protein
MEFGSFTPIYVLDDARNKPKKHAHGLKEDAGKSLAVAFSEQKGPQSAATIPKGVDHVLRRNSLIDRLTSGRFF